MTEFIKKGKIYYGTYDCGDSRIHSTKWKTEKGAIKHVDNCYMRPEEVEKRATKEEERTKNEATKQAELLETYKDKLKKAKDNE